MAGYANTEGLAGTAGGWVLNYAQTMPIVPKLCPFKLKMFT